MDAPLGSLFEALAKAQGQIQTAIRSEVNPKENYRYADLASIWGACRKALSENGIAVVQVPVYGEEDNYVGLRTILGHASGQSIEGSMWMRVDDSSPHALGSAITYLRKYSLASMVGVAADDDDGERAAVTPTTWAAPKPEKLPSAADIPHEGGCIDEVQQQHLHRMRKLAGGQWWTWDGDDENRPDSHWRSKILGVYRDAADERITRTSALCPAQYTHLLERIERYIQQTQRTAAKGFDIGDLNHG